MGNKTTARDRVDEAMGKRLKEAREAKRLTQKQMADCLGITTNAYQNYEYGKEISSGRIVQICALLECSPNWLFGVKEDGMLLPPDSALLEAMKNESPLLGQLKMAFYRLSEPGQREAVKRVQELTQLPEYIIDIKKTEKDVPNNKGGVSAMGA